MSFNEIKGQDRAIKILKQAITNNHLAQTYLFHGPEGVGKKKAAITFAKALNCTTHENDACDQCLSCRKIEQSIHPDISLLQQDKGEIKIGAIRDIINSMVYRPIEARKRVVIVDEADKCNISASNAFLKTLEEPPVDTVIILISSGPDTLPQTVLSRCHKVSFGNVPTQTVAEMLMQLKGLSQAKAESVACLADGSIGKAITLSSADVKEVREDILAGVAKGYRDPYLLFEMAERFSKDENGFYNALYWIHTYFRDILILKSHGDFTLLINKDMTDHFLKRRDQMTIERLLDIMGFIQSVYKGQERNVNKQLALEVLGTKIGDNQWK